MQQFLLSSWLAKASQDEKKKMIDDLATMVDICLLASFLCLALKAVGQVKDTKLHLLMERKPFESHRLVSFRFGSFS